MQKEGFAISTETSFFNLEYIHEFLANSYWAKDIPIETVQKSIDNSICFGVFHLGRQIGFARVITDYVVFAYLMDVFIAEEHRGKGYSSILISAMMNEPVLKNIKIWRLATSDAHFLYEKFGFKALANPEKMMEKVTI